MSETKFTPGPWKFHFAKWANEAPTQGYLIEAVDHEKPIASFNAKGKSDVPIMTDELVNQYRMPIGTYMTVDEAEANAKLIAAAPDMYEAIKNYIQAIEAGEVTDQLDALKIAVKKATE
jgi:hypothetical protein